MIKGVPTAPVLSAFAVVELEGPDQVARTAGFAVKRMDLVHHLADIQLLLAASADPTTPHLDRQQFRATILAVVGVVMEVEDLATAEDPVATAHDQLRTDIRAFTLEPGGNSTGGPSSPKTLPPTERDSGHEAVYPVTRTAAAEGGRR